MNLIISSTLKELIKTSASSSMSMSGSSGSLYSNKSNGVGYKSSTTAVNDSMIGTPVKSGLTTKLPRSASVYGKGNSGMGSKVPVNSTMMKQRSGTVDIKNSPNTAQAASNTISTRSTQGSLYKQAAISSLIRAGAGRIGRMLAKPIVKGFGRKGTYSALKNNTLKGIASKGSAFNPALYDEAKRTVKRKALKWGALGGLGYGSYQGAKYIKGTHTPYNKNFNYNKHIRDNVVSGKINPQQLHPNTTRSIMMKNGSFDKKAFVGTLVRKAIPAIGLTALSLPGARAEYKGKALLNNVRSTLKPKSMTGNIAKF